MIISQVENIKQMGSMIDSPVFWGAILAGLVNFAVSYRSIRKNREIQREIEEMKGSISKDLESHKNKLAIQKDTYSKDYDSIIKKRDEAAGEMLATLFTTYADVENLQHKVFEVYKSFQNISKEIGESKREQAAQKVETILRNVELIEKESSEVRLCLSVSLPVSIRKNVLWFDNSRAILGVINSTVNQMLEHLDRIETMHEFLVARAQALMTPGGGTTAHVVSSAIESAGKLKIICMEQSYSVANELDRTREVMRKEYQIRKPN